MRALFMVAACLGLAACATPSAGQIAGVASVPTQLSSAITLDDKLGVAVETAYQAAALFERTTVSAGLVSGASAARLAVLDQQAYNGVCLTRSAYDVANGRSPSSRADKCPASTKTNSAITYAQAAQQAVTMVQGLVAATQLAVASGKGK